MNAHEIHFLNLDDVLLIHRIAIEDQRGDPALRDLGLLESAMAMPRQQFDGQYAHPTIPDMAAAYAFHICQNHPFVDGNKRAAFGSMVGFLSLNSWTLDADTDEAENAILGLAAGKIDKAAITEWVKVNSHEKPSMELRDFFSQFTLQELVNTASSIQPDHGARLVESETSIQEAIQSMPVVEELFVHITSIPKDKKAEANTIVAIHFFRTFVALHRIAEDKGYEW